MTELEALAVLLAGALAGGVNTVVGSGSLITFPTLLAVGYSPIVANVSNTVGLVPGGVSGVIGYRRELRGQWRRCATLGVGTTIGAVIGGILLLELPGSVFDAVVPGADPARGRADGDRAVAAGSTRAATARPRESPRRSASASTAATSAPPRGSSCSR